MESVLLQVSRQVKKRRLLLHPYFQDFDRVSEGEEEIEEEEMEEEEDYNSNITHNTG